MPGAASEAFAGTSDPEIILESADLAHPFVQADCIAEVTILQAPPNHEVSIVAEGEPDTPGSVGTGHYGAWRESVLSRATNGPEMKRSVSSGGCVSLMAAVHSAMTISYGPGVRVVSGSL